MLAVSFTYSQRRCPICEPTQSIVQFDPPPDDTTPQGGDGDTALANVGKAKGGLHKIVEWCRKFGNWFHLSRCGYGHNEVMNKSALDSLRLPAYSLYETLWWQREVKPDGPLVLVNPADASAAIEAAKSYAQRTCIGNTGILRKFLEMSMRRSGRPHMYVLNFLEEMVRPERKSHVVKRLISAGLSPRALVSAYSSGWGMFGDPEQLSYLEGYQARIEGAIKVISGALRDLRNFHDCWRENQGAPIPSPAS